MSAIGTKTTAAILGRDLAYTSSRSDVVEMVPEGALEILDIGCSDGTLGGSLKALVPGRTVCGIEYDLSYARSASAALDYVVCADLNSLDWNLALDGRLFDCIVFADVLEHLVDPQRCLFQARQFLRPGGCVVISVPNIRHVSALWSIFVCGSFPLRARGLFDSTHLRWFTISDLNMLLYKSGFSISMYGLALRAGDKGGGLVNRVLNRMPGFIKRLTPVREFLTYQVCVRAGVRPSVSEI